MPVKEPIRSLLITCGTLCVALGVVGMFLPIMPTTPFLLLAAACYARSSERFYRRLVANRWCGAYIRHYREGGGLPLKQKVFTLLLLWLTMGSTAWLAISAWWLRVLLIGIAVGVTIHLVRIKTCKADAQPSHAPEGYNSPEELGG